MILTIGLGPIGANIGLRLAERGHVVGGLDFDAVRAEAWAEEASAPAWTSFDDVDWAQVDRVVVAVRLAEQVTACVRDIEEHIGERAMEVFVVTTLAHSDATEILPSMPRRWRVYEAPISGGPQGARDGSMTIFLAGPPLSPDSRAFLADIAGKVFETDVYGKPALLKLLNNTLGAYNAQSTARMIELASRLGVEPKQFLEVASASSGQSWMSDNFDNFHYELLFKDVRLLLKDVGTLPDVSFAETKSLDELIQSTRQIVEGTA